MRPERKEIAIRCSQNYMATQLLGGFSTSLYSLIAQLCESIRYIDYWRWNATVNSINFMTKEKKFDLRPTFWELNEFMVYKGIDIDMVRMITHLLGFRDFEEWELAVYRFNTEKNWKMARCMTLWKQYFEKFDGSNFANIPFR